LQRRAGSKYHSAGKWTNTCCSHPRPGEKTEDAAHRRLHEEMGLSCNLIHMFSFTYRAEMQEQIIEHEFDHVFIGMYDGRISPDPMEVKDYCYKSLEEIEATLLSHPQKYTAWFNIAFPRVQQWAAENLLKKVM
jgi:isopentenyl-diphosphate delta-isomerase